MSTPEDQVTVDDVGNTADPSESATAVQGALSSLANPPSTEEGKAAAYKVLQDIQSGKSRSGEGDILKAYEGDEENARQILREARVRLMQLQISPQEQAYQQAAAWSSPGSFWSELGNYANTRASQMEQQRKLAQQQQGEDLNLALKMNDVDQGVLNAKLKLQEMHEQQQNALGPAALRVLAAPTGPVNKGLELKTIDTPEGKQEVVFNPATGEIKPQGKPVVPGGGQLNDQTLDYIYQVWKDDHKIPTGFARSNMTPFIMSEIAKRAEAEGLTDQQILANSQLMKARQKAENDFEPGGKYGQALVSTNRVVSHLSDYMDLFDSLHNGDVQGANLVKNKISAWLGHEAPTDISAVAPILGDELTKSIVPGGGGVTERQEFGHNFSTASSPEQAAGRIREYLTFLKDQVDGTRYAYQQNLGRNDFDKRFLQPRTRQAFGIPEPQGSLTPQQRADLIAQVRAAKAAKQQSSGAP